MNRSQVHRGKKQKKKRKGKRERRKRPLCWSLGGLLGDYVGLEEVV